MRVKFSDLEYAFDFMSFDTLGDHQAFLCKNTGKFYYSSDFIDDEEEELPEDVYDEDKYIALPSKQELDLGKSLVFKFIEKSLPADYDQVNSMFHKKGAYSWFKLFLEKKNMLDQWYQYEQEAQLQAIKDWCEENNVEYSM